MFVKQALAIGVNDYGSSKQNLSSCIHDAKDLLQTLKSIGFQTRIGADSNIHQCRKLIDSFTSSIVPGSVALFYFSGHGCQKSGRNYLLPSPHNTMHEENPIKNMIDAQQVIEAIHRRRPRLIICILDCCRDDEFSELFRTKNGFFNKLPRDKLGLAPMSGPPATLIAFACAAGESASAESFNGRNSLYTAHLLRHIARPGVDIEKILKDVAIEVEIASRRTQVPYRYSSCNESIFLVDGIVCKQVKLHHSTRPLNHSHFSGPPYVSPLPHKFHSLSAKYRKPRSSYFGHRFNKFGHSRAIIQFGTYF